MRIAFLLAAALLCGCGGSATVPAEKPEPPFTALSLDEALVRAGHEDKLAFVDVSTTWCTWCKELDRTTWKDPAVRDWLEKRTVPVKIDGDQQQQVVAHYGIEGFPTLLFLQPDGSLAGRIDGYCDADAFLARAEDIAKTAASHR